MSAAINIVTPPATEPVTRDEAKTHLRVDGTADDTYIDGLITLSRMAVELTTGRALITQTREYSFDRFPASRLEQVQLPYPPLHSVVSVSYVDEEGITQTWGSMLYNTRAGTVKGRLYPVYGESYPTVRDQPYAVTVQYVAGYGDADDVPQPLKHAMLLLVGHYYESREATLIGVNGLVLPMGVDALLAPYRVSELP